MVDLLARVAVAAAEALDLRELGRRVLPALREAFDTSVIVAYRVGADGFETAVPPGGVDPMPAYEAFAASCPLFAVKRTAAERVVVPTEVVGARTLRRSAVYEACFRPYDADHQVSVRLSEARGAALGTTGIVLARSRRCGSWSGAELRRIEHLVPILVAAHRRNERWLAAERQREALAGIAEATAGVGAVFDRRGRAVWLSDEAAARLGGHGGEAALRAAVRRAAAGDETELELPATAGGDRLRLILSPGRARSGEVVVLARLHEPPVDPARVRANAARLGLTPAEIDVAEALARGLSNPEIAAELGITRGTVRTHLAHVYAKLGVHSRVRAVLALTGGRR